MSNLLAKSALGVGLELKDALQEPATSDAERVFNALAVLARHNRGAWAEEQYHLLAKDDTAEPSPQDYKDALTIQDACNISGVVGAFARVMHRINNQMRALKESSEWRGRHPIVRLYAEQIAHLGHVADTAAYRHAYEACKQLSQPTEKEDDRAE